MKKSLLKIIIWSLSVLSIALIIDKVFIPEISEEQKKVKVKTTEGDLNVPSFDLLLQFTQDKNREQNLDEYQSYYERVVQSFPQIAEAHQLLAFCHYYAGHYDKAQEYYQKSLQLNPNFFWTYYSLGVTQFKLGKYDDSLNSFKRGLAVNPDATLKIIFTSKIYQQILKNPSHYEKILIGDLKKGYENAQQFIALNLYYLSEQELKKQNFPQAQTLLENSIKIYPFSDSFVYLSEVFKVLEEDEGAAKAKKIADSLAKNNNTKNSILTKLSTEIF